MADHTVVSTCDVESLHQQSKDTFVFDFANAEQIGPRTAEHLTNNRGQLVELLVSNTDRPTDEFVSQAVGERHGTAGVAAYFVELHKVSGDEAHLAFAEKMTQNLLSRSTRAEHGQYWVQAEHRVRPELLQAQTGYMQGAAGIGLLLLQWDAFERDQDFPLRFPDSPF